MSNKGDDLSFRNFYIDFLKCQKITLVNIDILDDKTCVILIFSFVYTVISLTLDFVVLHIMYPQGLLQSEFRVQELALFQ